ncbi:MAG: PilZ domain-containing protein [Deltaproteobacteria bacterium]|nr:PilZ domain-containing protein [Deltaproteobacteria bacterium]
MSRATSGNDPRRTSNQADRRDAASPRVQFEALVEVGAGESGGFEAESIDVSPDGIRLRTAYLPNLGERLMCRFDGFGGEIVAEGEVIWRKELGRGGEFGLKFLGLDERGSALLREMCVAQAEPEAAPPVQRATSEVGSRVKLHIEGLGSPMRARIKDTARGEVLVGSSLEFLRVGRDIEIEDVEKGGRRTAMIEHVGVEIDRESSIPQLVVALRFDQARKSVMTAQDVAPAAKVQAPRGDKAEELEAGARESKETTPEPTVIDNDAPQRRALPPRKAPKLEVMPEDDAVEVEAAPEEDSETLATPTHREPGDDKSAAAEKVGKALGGLAKTLGPKLSQAGSSARSALGSVLDAVKRKRGERELSATGKGAKRTTAPPPGGALRSDGRRLFRQQGRPAVDAAETVEVEVQPKPRRAAVVALVTAALTVVGVYVFASQIGKKNAADPAALAAAPGALSAEAQAAAPGGPIPGGAVATANVPLFGATPLSTTEPVPAPPNPDALALDGGDAPPAPGAGSAAPMDGEAGEDAAGGPSGDAEGNGSTVGGAASTLRKTWGVGEVHDPVSLKLTMDGEVSGFSGSEGATGFTVVVPGRKSVSSVSGMARKDKRIETFNVVNYPDRAEVTVQFKGDIPPFAVKSSGNRVTIDLDGGKGAKAAKSDDGEVSSAKKKSKSALHDRSKTGDKAKKADSKNAKQTSDGAKGDKKKGSKKSDKKKPKK